MRIVFRELVADDDDDSAVEVVVDNSGKIDLVVIGFLCLHSRCPWTFHFLQRKRNTRNSHRNTVRNGRLRGFADVFMRDKEALRKLPKEHGWNIQHGAYVVAACLRSFGLFVGRDFAKYLGCILKQILCYRLSPHVSRSHDWISVSTY